MKDVNECKVVEELLSPFFDEELNEEADALVRRHLDTCGACLTKLEELKETVSAINALPIEATPDEGLWTGVADATGLDAGVPPLHGRDRRGFRFPRLMQLAAMLATLMVPAALVVGGIRLLSDGDDAVDMPVLADVEPAPSPPAPGAIGRPPRAPRAPVSDGRLEALIGALSDSDAQVRRTAARTLGDMGDRRAMQALVGALADSDGEVRRWAAWGLGEIGAGDGQVTERLMEVLLSDPVDEVRRWAAWALGEIQNDHAVPALAAALESDPAQEVRRWSAWALGEIQDERAVSGLVTGLKDDWYEARRWSAWALGEIADSRAVPGLSEALLRDESAEVRRWSAWALGEIGDPSANDALSKALQDESAEVRRWAIWALGETGGR